MDASEVDEGIISKVQKLIAQAEGTTFAEEAETFYAKATEIMQRHAIDEAMLAARGKAEQDVVDCIELGFGSTYWQSWYNGLAAIGRALGFRPLIIDKRKNGSMEWYGWRSELKIAEVLLASIQIQVSRSVNLWTQNVYEPPEWMNDSEIREDRFNARRSFIEAYLSTVALRIATQREATRRKVSEEHGQSDGSLLPVLVSKDGLLQSELAQIFAHTTKVSAPRAAVHREGWSGGRSEGQRADINGAKVGGTRGAISRG